MDGMIRLAPIAAVLLTLVVAQAAVARDIHVSNRAGDDRFNGRSTQRFDNGTGPVRTIGRALELAQPGDRIVLAKTEQPYRESITVAGRRHSQYPGMPLTIDGNDAVLDGSRPVPEDAWEHYRGDVFRFRPPRAAHGNLFLDDVPADRVIPELGADYPPKLAPREWCLLNGWMYFAVEPSKLPTDYAVTYAHHCTGITLYHVHGVAISGLTVQGFQLDGIAAANSATEVRLNNVVARGNGRAGVSVGGASSVVLEDCLIGNNGEAQLLTLPYSAATVKNSELIGNTAPGWVDRGGRVAVDGEPVDGGLDDVAPGQAE